MFTLFLSYLAKLPVIQQYQFDIHIVFYRCKQFCQHENSRVFEDAIRAASYMKILLPMNPRCST